MKVTSREIVLSASALMAALIAGSVMLMRPRYETYRTMALRQQQARDDIAGFEELLSQKASWGQQFEELKAWLPKFPIEKDMQTHWLSVMDTTAAKHGLVIGKRQTRVEEQVGDIYELPIDCRDWDGTLESLVQFMFDLQSEGAMLDLRQLYVRPVEGLRLRGSFTLFCAYTRTNEKMAVAPVAASNGS